MIQKSLEPLQSKDFTLSIYFGKNLAKRYAHLSKKLFSLIQAPMMRAQFTWSLRQKKWLLQNIGPIAINDVPEDHRSFLQESAFAYFSGRQAWPKTKTRPPYDLAILVSPDEEEPPSDEKAPFPERLFRSTRRWRSANETARSA